MECHHKMLHQIRAGDSLFRIAQYYRTSVPQILALNPNIDPQNLPIGGTLVVCAGRNVQPPGGQPPSCPSPARQIELINQMRLLWSQHVYWTRMTVISIIEQRSDLDATQARLLQNPADLAALFGRYYPEEAVAALTKLITEHLQIAGALVTALRDGKAEEAAALNQQWYQNADQMSRAFAALNPYYSFEEVQRMFYRHLDLTKQEAAQRLTKNYPADIQTFDMVEQEAMEMADMFSRGLLRQFPV